MAARLNTVVSIGLSEHNSPLTPRALADSFVNAVAVLSIDIKAKLVLFKLFDRYVIQELPSLFKIVEQSLTQHGIVASPLPNRQRGSRGSSAQNNQHANNGNGAVLGREQRDNNGAQPDSAALYHTLQSLLQAAPAQSQQRADFSDTSYTNNSHNNSYDNYAVTEVSLALINALSQIQQQQVQQAPSLGAAQSGAVQPTLLSASNIRTAIQSSGGELLVDQRSQDVMKLVDMLFTFILEDNNLPNPIKLLLARLQIPFIKVALADEDFFKKEGHPARRLLNEMAMASIGWTGDVGAEKRDTLLNKIESTVSRILKDFDTNFEIFTLLLTDFIAFMEKERRRVLLFEKRAVDAEAGKAKSEIGRKEVDKKLAELTKDKDIPKSFKDFIVGPWANILFLIYMRQGLDSKQWSNAVKIASELVWSALPIEDDTHKVKLSMLLPRLDNALKKSLESISFNPAKQAQYLEVFHEHYASLFKRYRQKPFAEAKTDAPIKAELKTSNPVNNTSVNRNEVDANADANINNGVEARGDAENSVLLKQEAVPTSQSPNNEAPRDNIESVAQARAAEPQKADAQYINLVDNFTVGVWFEKQDDDIVSYRCRLAAIIRGTSKYIFVNRAGVKVAEETRETLAVLLQQGKLRTLDDGMLFDRALESVITNLRSPK